MKNDTKGLLVKKVFNNQLLNVKRMAMVITLKGGIKKDWLKLFSFIKDHVEGEKEEGRQR